MMWVSSTTKINKQDEKWVVQLRSVWKWAKTKRKQPKGSPWRVPMED
jgi:hypothetical protein